MNTLENLARDDLAASAKHGRQAPDGDAAHAASPELTAAAALFGLLRTVSIHDRDMARRHGVTPQQYDALLEIHFCTGPEPVTIGGLAQRLSIRHNSVVATVNKLCHRGLVTRTPSQRDRRLMHLALTDHGRALLLMFALADRDRCGAAAAGLR